ncbi:MAG: cupin domain-containing protein [Lachnospirales bacterium]
MEIKLVEEIIKNYNLKKLEEEGVYVDKIYCSPFSYKEDVGVGSSMIGLYSPYVNSKSCFHKLTNDELWHFYGGDPLELYLLYEDGKTENIILGSDFRKGHRTTYVVKANTWQGGCTYSGGVYSLFGCTVFPEFTIDCFTAGEVDYLVNKYPEMKDVILKLTI